MAQRTPIRSILSVVPSNQSSGDTPNGEQTSERGASPKQNSSEGQSLPDSRANTRRQRQQQVQVPPQQRQPAEKSPSQRIDLFQPPLANKNNGRQASSPPQLGRRSNSPVPLVPKPPQSGNVSDLTSRRSAPVGQPNSSSSRRSGKQTNGQKPNSAGQPSRAERRSARQSSAQGNQQASGGNRQGSAANAPVPSNSQPGASAGSRQQRARKAKPSGKSISPLVQIIRLSIVGVGIGVIAGTLLSIFDPASRFPAEVSGGNVAQSQQIEQAESSTEMGNAAIALQLSGEIAPLKTQLQSLAAQNSDLVAGAFFVDIDTGSYVDLNGSVSFSAASTIKVPVLIAFFQDVDAGKIRLEEKLTMKSEDVATGSGEMQYQPPGKQFTAMETVVSMISISDNTATNMLIKRLGGAAVLNQRFKSWGLTETTIRNKLPDLEGTNTTSPRDLVNLMAMVDRGKLVSLRSRDRIFDIMRRTVNDSLLPQGLGAGATIAHKTGDIGSTIADAGLVDLPSGKRYLAAVTVKRPHNDPRAEELIRQFSRVVYQHFSQPPAK